MKQTLISIKKTNGGTVMTSKERDVLTLIDKILRDH